MTEPIKYNLELTPEQRQQYMKGKTKRFLELFEEAEKETGLTFNCFLMYGKAGIIPTIQIVEKIFDNNVA